MGDFLSHNFATILQLIVTFYMASIARQFQVAMAIYGTRLETHREAVRRSRVLWWLDKKGEVSPALQEMQDWFAVNEVYLSPAAAGAFQKVYLWKQLAVLDDGQPLPLEFKDAKKALETLRAELLQFRKRRLRDLLLRRRS